MRAALAARRISPRELRDSGDRLHNRRQRTLYKCLLYIYIVYRSPCQIEYSPCWEAVSRGGPTYPVSVAAGRVTHRNVFSSAICNLRAMAEHLAQSGATLPNQCRGLWPCDCITYIHTHIALTLSDGLLVPGMFMQHLIIPYRCTGPQAYGTLYVVCIRKFRLSYTCS